MQIGGIPSLLNSCNFNSGKRAFTLLEIILVVAIMSLVVGIGITTTSISLTGQKLQEQVQDIRKHAKMARLEAVKHGLPCMIMIDVSGLTVRTPLSKDEAVESDENESPPESEFKPEENLLSNDEAINQMKTTTLALQEGMSIKTKMPQDQDWMEPENLEWSFSSSGICAPLSMRLEFENSWIEVTFSPLTAEIVEERYEWR